MKIYITGLPSGYEVEHLARLFYPMAPLTLTPPEPAEDCLWAEKTDTGLRVLVRQGEKSKTLEAPLPLPVQRGHWHRVYQLLLPFFSQSSSGCRVVPHSGQGIWLILGSARHAYCST